MRRGNVDTVAGAFGEGATYVHQQLSHKSVLVGAEAERARSKQISQQQAKLQGLSDCSHLSAGFRCLMVTQHKQNRDGDRGVDFRKRDRTSARTKAKTIRGHHKCARRCSALLFFRKHMRPSWLSGDKVIFERRLVASQMPKGYLRIAQALRLF